tara:strand:+ start:7 stop:480 length:474 start_codon:yes stop_codon:yes gene_type:complete
MKYTRFFKKCEDFSICSELGDSDCIVAEHTNERRTLYQIVVYGSGKVARPFESEFKVLDSSDNNFVNLKEYLHDHTIFHSTEPFHMYGFNTSEKYVDWDGRLVTESFTGDDKSWLICFNGSPVVNGKVLHKLDYAKLSEKDYNVVLNDGILGMFTKL